MGRTGSMIGISNPGDPENYIWNETLEKEQFNTNLISRVL